jgi:hypothetical protein
MWMARSFARSTTLGDVVAEVAARRRREVRAPRAIVRDEAVRTYDRFLSRARRQRAAVA